MPDDIAPAPAGAPVAVPAVTPVVVAPVAAPVVAPAAPAAPVVAAPAAPVATETPATGQPDPTWLRSRIDQAKRTERSALLAELGVTDPEKAKQAIAAANKAAEDEKALAIKLQERDLALTTATTRLGALEQTIKARADVELAGLSDAQRAAVAAVAGEDSARVLSTIDALKPTWGVAAPVVAPAVVAPAPAPPAAAPPAPVVAPATTSPPPVAPGAAPGSPPNHKAEYERLKKTSGVAAAAYLNRYERDIYPRA